MVELILLIHNRGTCRHYSVVAPSKARKLHCRVGVSRRDDHRGRLVNQITAADSAICHASG